MVAVSGSGHTSAHAKTGQSRAARVGRFARRTLQCGSIIRGTTERKLLAHSFEITSTLHATVPLHTHRARHEPRTHA